MSVINRASLGKRRIKLLQKRSTGDRIFFGIIVFFMSIFALSFIFIFVWMFLNSLRTVPSYNSNPMALFDFSGVNEVGLFHNYEEVFSYTHSFISGRTVIKASIGDMFLNSIIYVSIIMLGSFLFPPAVGYVIAKYNFTGKKVIVMMVLFTMIVPGVGVTTSTLMFFDQIHLTNSWLSIILMSWGGLGFGVILYSSYFKSISSTYIEAAKIDGANDFLIYFKVMLPQAKPLLITQLILNFIGAWNDYTTPYLFLQKNPTIALGVNDIYLDKADSFPVIYAALFIISFVSITAYGIFSKKIMNNMSIGGLKG